MVKDATSEGHGRVTRKCTHVLSVQRGRLLPVTFINGSRRLVAVLNPRTGAPHGSPRSEVTQPQFAGDLE